MVEVTHGETLSDLTASRDLRALVNASLFKPIGERRGRYYVVEPSLLAEQQQIRSSRAPKETDDPFERAFGQLDLAMP